MEFNSTGIFGFEPSSQSPAFQEENSVQIKKKTTSAHKNVNSKNETASGRTSSLASSKLCKRDESFHVGISVSDYDETRAQSLSPKKSSSQELSSSHLKSSHTSEVGSRTKRTSGIYRKTLENEEVHHPEDHVAQIAKKTLSEGSISPRNEKTRGRTQSLAARKSDGSDKTLEPRVSSDGSSSTETRSSLLRASYSKSPPKSRALRTSEAFRQHLEGGVDALYQLPLTVQNYYNEMVSKIFLNETNELPKTIIEELKNELEAFCLKVIQAEFLDPLFTMESYKQSKEKRVEQIKNMLGGVLVSYTLAKSKTLGVQFGNILIDTNEIFFDKNGMPNGDSTQIFLSIIEKMDSKLEKKKKHKESKSDNNDEAKVIIQEIINLTKDTNAIKNYCKEIATICNDSRKYFTDNSPKEYFGERCTITRTFLESNKKHLHSNRTLSVSTLNDSEPLYFDCWDIASQVLSLTRPGKFCFDDDEKGNDIGPDFLIKFCSELDTLNTQDKKLFALEIFLNNSSKKKIATITCQWEIKPCLAENNTSEEAWDCLFTFKKQALCQGLEKYFVPLMKIIKDHMPTISKSKLPPGMSITTERFAGLSSSPREIRRKYSINLEDSKFLIARQQQLLSTSNNISPVTNSSGSGQNSPNLKPILMFQDEIIGNYKNYLETSQGESSKIKIFSNFSDHTASAFFFDAIRNAFKTGTITFNFFRKFDKEIVAMLIKTMQDIGALLKDSLPNSLSIENIKKYENVLKESPSPLFETLKKECLEIAELCHEELKLPFREHLCWTEHLYVKQEKEEETPIISSESTQSLKSSSSEGSHSKKFMSHFLKNSSGSTSTSSQSIETSPSIALAKSFLNKALESSYTVSLDCKLVNSASFSVDSIQDTYDSLKFDALPCFIGINGQIYHTKSATYTPLSAKLKPYSKSFRTYSSINGETKLYSSQIDFFSDFHLHLYKNGLNFSEIPVSALEKTVKNEAAQFATYALKRSLHNDPFIKSPTDLIRPLRVTELMGDKCAIRAILYMYLLFPKFFPEENGLKSDYMILYKDKENKLMKEFTEFHIDILDKDNFKVNHINELKICSLGKKEESVAWLRYSWINYPLIKSNSMNDTKFGWESKLVIEDYDGDPIHLKNIMGILEKPQNVKKIKSFFGVEFAINYNNSEIV